MTVYALLFEAESIQSFIHDSGRLRDAVGASQIVEDLCGSLEAEPSASDLVSRVLRQCGSPSVGFSRRGGGAFIAFFESESDRIRFRALWAMVLAELAPGLRWVDAVADEKSEYEAANAGMAALRGARLFQSAELPETGPLVCRAPRTGKAASGIIRLAGGPEYTDRETRRKREVAQDEVSLSRRFSGEGGIRWPRDLERDDDELDAFPFLPGLNELAFIHADGNGLGAALHGLSREGKTNPAQYRSAYAGFSLAVSRATAAAAADATKAVLLPAKDGLNRMPARPLVLGGDDLSIIVRPDLAVRFAESFMLAFEKHTTDELEKLKARLPNLGMLPSSLTAACGIAIVGSSYPFLQASDIAVWLCDHAKAAIKAEKSQVGRDLPLSALMFHRLTSSLPGHDDALLDSESVQGGGLRLDGGPYIVSDAKSTLPSVSSLRELSRHLGADDASRGPGRQLITLLYEQPALARATWQHWKRALARSAPQRLDSILGALEIFGVDRSSDLPFSAASADRPRTTPLADAILLRDLEADRNEESK